MSSSSNHYQDEVDPLLSVKDLQVAFGEGHNAITVVSHVSTSLRAGEVLAVVGESGSGKTIFARSLLGLLPPGGKIAGGQIWFKGQDLCAMPHRTMRKIRGAHIGMVFQEPMMSLNPALKVGEQLAEAMRLHTKLKASEIRSRSIEMLKRVRMTDPEHALDTYPHEFSGGMRQRIMLASVFMMQPDLLIADEPTTALDVIIQKEVLDLMIKIARDLKIAVLFITHDLGVVAEYADRILVMYKGEVCEDGSTNEILISPKHPYTKSLLEALPGRRSPVESKKGRLVSAEPLIEIEDLKVHFHKRKLLPWKKSIETRAVDGVDLTIMPGEMVALVGESGSGKTTFGRSILNLIPKSYGRIAVNGISLDVLDNKAKRRLRQKCQIIFQDPFSSLDPRMRIDQIIGEGLRHDTRPSKSERRERVAMALASVGLSHDFSSRFPHELSGGQRQRVSIARAIIMEPELIVADEPVSALDVTVQAQILELFQRLQSELGFACLFISHDLSVVEQISDRVLVMYRGHIVEMGSRDDIFDKPMHPYTCQLLNSVPVLKKDGQEYRISKREFASPVPPHLWRFAPVHNADTAIGSFQNCRLQELEKGHFISLCPDTKK